MPGSLTSLITAGEDGSTSVTARVRLGKALDRLMTHAPAITIPSGPRVAAPVQLPQWPEVTRGVPNGVLRSSLCGAIQKGPRRYMDRERLDSLEGIEIYYTGQRLDQGDLDVWLMVLHFARLQKTGMGQQCRFTTYAMLQQLRKSDSGGNRKVLHKCLLRLKANCIEVTQGRFSYIGSLIDKAYRDEATREYVIVLDEKLHPLFGSDQFTQVDWNVRRALAGHPLAQWLHGFYASHAKPFPMKGATLLSLSGSENVEPRSSLQKLRKALRAVSNASAAYNQPFSYEFRGDLVHVEKTPSRPQRRHIARKANQHQWSKA